MLVYHGILPQVPSVTRGILPNLEMPTPHHTILFTDEEQIALAERKNVLRYRLQQGIDSLTLGIIIIMGIKKSQANYCIALVNTIPIITA